MAAFRGHLHLDVGHSLHGVTCSNANKAIAAQPASVNAGATLQLIMCPVRRDAQPAELAAARVITQAQPDRM